MIIDTLLNNGLTFYFKALDKRVDSKAIFAKDNHNNISLTFFFTGLDCSFSLADKQNHYELKFYFPFQYLENYFSQQADNYFHQFSSYEETEICCSKQLILHEIINCKMQGAYKQMFLESKALGLLLCFQKCQTEPNNGFKSCKFLLNPVEKEKIYKAKAIILSRLNNPMTIPELSMEVCINQCYLKKGFKEIFGTTIYDFVQEQRMINLKKNHIIND
ncbi:MAG: helix-turn-helix transcriptional regulator [Bacteroidetes bacterium]|nr:helix-turn-helix transcriptional regulator [Bacteroidota bacterium]